MTKQLNDCEVYKMRSTPFYNQSRFDMFTYCVQYMNLQVFASTIRFAPKTTPTIGLEWAEEEWQCKRWVQNENAVNMIYIVTHWIYITNGKIVGCESSFDLKPSKSMLDSTQYPDLKLQSICWCEMFRSLRFEQKHHISWYLKHIQYCNGSHRYASTHFQVYESIQSK